MSRHNIVSVSGGKDSTATLLLAIILETPNLQAVFAEVIDLIEHWEGIVQQASKCGAATFFDDSNATPRKAQFPT